VIGVDISDVAVEKARQLARDLGFDNIHPRVMNAEAMDLPDNSIDVISGFGIVHHLDIRRAFKEMARVLRPGGEAVFLEPLGHNPIINLYRKLTPGLRTPDEHPLLVSDVEVAREYFREVDAKFFNLSTFLALPLRRLRAFHGLVACLDWCDRAAFTIFPFTRRYAWQVRLKLSQPIKDLGAISPTC
jgi:SAM-dependent methyltransferase